METGKIEAITYNLYKLSNVIITPIEVAKTITKRQTTIKDTLKAEHLQQILTLVRNSKLFTKKEKETFFD